ncbi:Glycerol-3-phosphate acyltransferase 3 [Liparis tanakae]|uniref:Glycerol-3-phosphate acyltransferase 3 n=1 Tax=Liparis tanakae TaxID=230148 RepID=A0A4Z2E0M1_9TELE|nr:Glycerol-3-phosphate acyltransferase 3 [Liparis tanakae]
MKFWLSEWVHVMCYRICARGLSATIRYHDRENKPQKGGICVANHTSPIDIVILCNDGCYAMVPTAGTPSHGSFVLYPRRRNSPNVTVRWGRCTEV